MTSTLRVASSSESLTASLTEAICNHLGTVDETNEGNIVKISNRYFDAAVALEPLSLDNAATNTSNAEDGLLLVFDGASKQAFDGLAQLQAAAETHAQNGDLLRLCIGVVSQDAHLSSVVTAGTKEHEEEYARRILWCLDRGYEYVEGVDLSLEGVQQGHEEREKEGFARVMEAIQGTVWTSAKMHPQKQQQLKQSYQQAQEELLPEEDDHENQYEPPPTTMPLPTLSEEESKEREEKARATLLKQDDINSSDAANGAYEYIDGSAAAPEDPAVNDDRKAERIFSDMEGAIQEANRIRALSKAGELNDEDRRQRAGDAAQLMMNLMQQMGGLESDSDEGGEHEDSSDADEDSGPPQAQANQETVVASK